VLELSLRQALRLDHNYIGTEHLLLGLLDDREDFVLEVLSLRGADPESLRQAVIDQIEDRANRAKGEETSDLPTVSVRAVSPDSLVRRHISGGKPVPTTSGSNLVLWVEHPGRDLKAFTEAYTELSGLLTGLAIEELDPSLIEITSIETKGGPGLRLAITVPTEIDDS
jgi:hypothetical protein